MRSRLQLLRSRTLVFGVAVAMSAAIVAVQPEIRAAETDPPARPQVSCRDFMPPRATIGGKSIGIEECQMQDAVEVADTTWPEVTRVLGSGGPYMRVDMGISGTLYGYVVRDGPRKVEFTSGPEFVFAQAGNKTAPARATLRYQAARGSSMTILYPKDRSKWNRKMYVMVHGAGRSFRFGNMDPWDEVFDPAAPLGDISKLEKVMLLKGYAVAITRRNTYSTKDEALGDYSVKLDDGTVLQGRNNGEDPKLIIDFVMLARNFLKSRLGASPSRIYWYGKSGGARLGRLVNYIDGMNNDESGKPIVDGMLVDDSGAGLWVPVVPKDGKNVLFDDKSARDRFVRTIEIWHQLYNSERNDDASEGVSQNFLENKRLTGLIMREKGLDNRFRHYEVRQISHNGGESLPDQKRNDVQILPLWQLTEAWIDMLDAWVEKGTEPPVSKSDDPRLGDKDADGISDQPAISMPAVACPLGTYYQFPQSTGPGGTGNTGFSPFDGGGLELLDGRTKIGGENYFENFSFADANFNGVRDQRETVTAAWRRLGLLSRGEKFTQAKYVECVKSAVANLQRDRLLTDKVAAFYVDDAAKGKLPDWVR